jgi:nicotinamide mononucleotide transporter
MEVWSEITKAASNMSVLEILAVFFGVLSVWFSKKENILVYPTGIISVLIYVYLCFEIGLYADMGINVFYFVMSIYGWYNWIPFKDKEVLDNTDKTLKISKNTTSQNIGYAVLIGIFWLVLYFILARFTDSNVPYADAFTTAVCLVGMWLMALKKIENWVLWIIADVISIPLYFYKGMPLSSLQFVFFTGLAVSGYLEWKGKLKEA